MRTLVKVFAVLLVLAAPVAAPEFLMQQAQAQEVNANGLTDAQQEELDAALEGTPEEVEEKLEDLLASYSNNTAVQDALIDAARDADTSDAVDRVVRTVTTAARTQQNANNNNNNDTLANNGSSVFGVFIGNQYITLPVRTFTQSYNAQILNYQSRLQADPNSVFAQFYQARIARLQAQLTQYGLQQTSFCVNGFNILAGPYGTVTSSPC